MRTLLLNGTDIPYDLPIEKLNAMLSSSDMKEFSLACEALSYNSDDVAYQLMKSHINDKDKYRRLYILKTIFRHPQATELIDYLERSISSVDFLFVENGLLVVKEHKIKVSSTLLLSAVKKHLSKLSASLGALSIIEPSLDNYKELLTLFEAAKKCVQKEILAEVLIDKFVQIKSRELFTLFSKNSFAKIRLLSIKIAMDYEYDLSIFSEDADGHIRNAIKNLNR